MILLASTKTAVNMLETIPPVRSLKSEGTFDDDVILRRSGSSRNLSSNRSSRDRSSKPKSAASSNRHSLFAPLTGATKLGSSLRSLSPFRHRGPRRSSFTEHVSSSSSSSKCIIFACYLGFRFWFRLMFVQGPPWWCSGRQKMLVIFCTLSPCFSFDPVSLSPS